MEGATRAVVGVFSYLDDTVKGIKRIQSTGLNYRVYSPTPLPELEELTFPQKSPVRIVSLIGAITGLAFGWGLAIWCSLDLPLRTSAKDIVSVPAFFVPGYECTILFGGLSTLFAMLYFCRLPTLFAAGYDPRFSNDKFGIVVECGGNQADDVKRKLLESGADDVDVREGL